MASQTLIDRIQASEALRLKPYKDSEDIWTIGWGRNLEKGITKDEAWYLFANDLAEAERELNRVLPWAKGKLVEARYEVLLDMCFNLGPSRLAGFAKMISALLEDDFERAAEEMLDSKWARQVGDRAKHLADVMKKGVA